MGQRLASWNNQQNEAFQAIELYGNQVPSAPTVLQQPHPGMIQMMATTTPVVRHPVVGPRNGGALPRKPQIINHR